LPTCLIDATSSPDYERLLKKLRKKYPRAEEDLAAAFEDIARDFTTACQANAVPGFHRAVWKYRCKSSNMQRGRSGGFRILAYYAEASNTLFAIAVYTKDQYEQQPPTKDVRKWLSNLIRELEIGPTLFDL